MLQLYAALNGMLQLYAALNCMLHSGYKLSYQRQDW
jgi:hypothetical protein